MLSWLLQHKQRNVVYIEESYAASLDGDSCSFLVIIYD